MSKKRDYLGCIDIDGMTGTRQKYDLRIGENPNVIE